VPKHVYLALKQLRYEHKKRAARRWGRAAGGLGDFTRRRQRRV